MPPPRSGVRSPPPPSWLSPPSTTAASTRRPRSPGLVVAAVLTSLAIVVVASLLGGEARGERLSSGWEQTSVLGTLEAAGLLFFAFAGYARIATLGEEVRDPERTIPRAIPLALGITLLVYAAVAASVLLSVGAQAMAGSRAPLADAVRAGDFSSLTPIVRAGAALAALSVLLSLLAGVSRTTFAMAAGDDLPRWLAAVHPRFKVPHHAELVVGAVVAVTAVSVDLRTAIGFSSFAVLLYYAITNAAAVTLSPAERRWPRSLAALGAIGCAVLAFTLPPESVLAGIGVFAAGGGLYALRHRRRIGPPEGGAARSTAADRR